MENNDEDQQGMMAGQKIPSFDLQRHHSWVNVPTEFDMRDLVRKHLVFPLAMVNIGGRKHLLLAMRDCLNQKVIQEVEFRAGVPVVPVVAEELDIRWLVHRHLYGRSLTPTPSSRPREESHQLFETLVAQPSLSTTF